MKILHFSDSHAGAPAEEWSSYLDKRWVGIFNYWFRRRFQHDQKVLKKAAEIMIKSDADLIICSGDITSTGQPSEFKKALEILEPLAKSKRMLYVPGNHDFYVFDEKCNNAMRDAFLVLNNNTLTMSDLPAKITYDECDIIIVNESWPANLISSCGSVKKKDSNLIENMLKIKDKPVILLGHYPLIEDRPIMRLRHRLWGQERLSKMLRDGKIDISLCGHVHRPYQMQLGDRGRGEYCSGSVTKNAVISEIIYDKEVDVFSHKLIKI
ncbi:MAG TPA: metallophosphoesterase [Victivallales bacterium]|nr:metallophosphoesterase [Victivallales bacterium]